MNIVKCVRYYKAVHCTVSQCHTASEHNKSQDSASLSTLIMLTTLIDVADVNIFTQRRPSPLCLTPERIERSLYD